MKPRVLLTCILPAALVAALVVWLVIDQRALARLRAEQEDLLRQNAEMTALAARNEELSNQLAAATAPEPLRAEELAELLRLRGQVGLLRRKPVAIQDVRRENQQIHVVLAKAQEVLAQTNVTATADYWPRESWRNLGRGSPEATFQSALWASSNGDFTNLLSNLTEEGQTKLYDEFKGKSAEETSIRLAEEMFQLDSVQVLSRDVADENTAILTVEISDGRTASGPDKIVMKRINGEWKFAGPP
jgi:hypothetical protein